MIKNRRFYALRRMTAAAVLAAVAVCTAVFGFGNMPAARVSAAVVSPLHGGVTIDEYLGCTIYPEDWLAQHFFDGYYLGTPYSGLNAATGRNPISISRFNGDAAGAGACNCAGVPSALMRNCGGNLSRIASYGHGAYVNATNWKNTILNNGNILCYHFNTMDEALDSGLIRKGDLFYLDPISWDLPGIDCHIGVLWGDNPSQNMGIHSVPPDVQYSPVAFDPAAFTFYVFPTRHRDLRGYGDPEALYGAFDAYYYFLTYPDVASAYDYNVPFLYYHFTNVGLYEGRRGSLVYDPAYYHAHRAGGGTDTITEAREFQSTGMDQGVRGSAEFDPAYYRRTNPDLASAYGDNWRAYYIHYMTYGVWEGRKGADDAAAPSAPADSAPAGTQPAAPAQSTGSGASQPAGNTQSTQTAPVIFDAQYYLNRYPDLRAAYGNDTEAAWMHFLCFGMNEARVASPTFDVSVYRSSYPDLNAAFGDDWQRYFWHYLGFGFKEGRKALPGQTAAKPAQSTAQPAAANAGQSGDAAIFDVRYYLDRYPDLRAAYGNDAAAARDHFEAYGKREARVASAAFDVKAYRSRYGDLNAAFGDDWPQYYTHYQLYGKAEGRNGLP